MDAGMGENARGWGFGRTPGGGWVDEQVHSLKRGLGLSQDFHNGIKAERGG